MGGFYLNITKINVKESRRIRICWIVFAVAVGKYRWLAVLVRLFHRHYRRRRVAFGVAWSHPLPTACYHQRSNAPIWPGQRASCHNRSRPMESELFLRMKSVSWVLKRTVQTIWHLPSGSWMRLNTSISWSIATNGPRKQFGGGSIEHSVANAGGCGNVPPGSGCSPG